MKRFIIIILTATIFAVALGIVAFYNGQGYVAISFADFTLETTVVFSLGVIILSFFIIHYLLRVLSGVFYFPNYVNRRHTKKKAERVKNALVKGLIEMSEGRFEQAEKILIKNASASDTSLLNYLMAARSAQQLGDYNRRDEYLRLAHESMPSADIAIGLTQAELQLSHKQFEQALATLNHLSVVSPKHGYVKKLLARVYQQLGDWDSLGPVLKDVRKLKVLDESVLEEREIEAFCGMLKNSIKQVDGEKTEKIWNDIPKRLKSNSELVRLYSSYLANQNKQDLAEALIRGKLNDEWNDELALMYSNLIVSDPTKQLESAEIWLRGQSRNAVFLLVLGKLCLGAKLWGKARSYFESSIGIEPSAEAYLKLAELLESKMDEHEEAEKMYRFGLKIAVSSPIREGDSSLPNNLLLSQPLLKVIQ